MDRREFIRNLSAGGAVTLASPFYPIQGKHGGNAPNILYLFTDQQTALAMSCAGNPYVKTPGMDSIAAMGIRFVNCYATQPLCGPNRTCMFTGMLPHQTGATVNLEENQNKVLNNPMLGRLVAQAGYRTGYFGKWHIASSHENKQQHGFEDIWCGSEYKIKDFDNQVAEKTIQFITKQGQKPFFAVASFINPHNICEMARGNKNKEQKFPNYDMPRYPEIHECPPLPDNFRIPENEPEELRKLNRDEINERVYPVKNWTENDWRQYLWAYYRMVEHVDNSVLKIVNSLRQEGMLEKTVIIFSSDHGEGCGAQQWNQKQVLYENVLKIPFIVSWKGVTKPGVINSTFVNNGLDLLPTICGFAGASYSGKYFGKNLKQVILRNQLPNENDFIVSETVFSNNTLDLGLSGRCLRTRKFKYIVYNKGVVREQLFDIETDPVETANLSAKQPYKTILNQHRSMLKKWCLKTNDDFNCIDADI